MLLTVILRWSSNKFEFQQKTSSWAKVAGSKSLKDVWVPGEYTIVWGQLVSRSSLPIYSFCSKWHEQIPKVARMQLPDLTCQYFSNLFFLTDNFNFGGAIFIFSYGSTSRYFVKWLICSSNSVADQDAPAVVAFLKWIYFMTFRRVVWMECCFNSGLGCGVFSCWWQVYAVFVTEIELGRLQKI